MGQRLLEPDKHKLHPVVLDFARNLRRARLNSGLTQRELADRAVVTQAALSQYERGVILPKLPAMIDLADVLGVPLWQLLKPGTIEDLSSDL